MLRARLAGVSADQRELLELLAIAEPVGLALLSKLADPRDIETMERAGLIAVTVSGRRMEARLAYPLYSELLRGDMPAIAAKRYNRQTRRPLRRFRRVVETTFFGWLRGGSTAAVKRRRDRCSPPPRTRRWRMTLHWRNG